MAGCGADGPDAGLADYLTRVGRLTDSRVPAAPPDPGPRYPEPRTLVVDVPQRTINVVEFFELHECDMGELVGFRNSPLGRLQSASQRLGYEHAWIRSAERCGADAAAWLAELGADKRQWLPALFWNATFAADEMRTAMGAAAAPAQGDLADILRGLSDQLSALGDDGFDLDALERLLGRLRQGSWAGPARADWSRWRRYLNAASARLRNAVPGICLTGEPTPDSRRLENVFLKYYIGRLQPQLARDMRRQQAWIRELEALRQRLEPVTPTAFEDWYAVVLSPQAPASEWRRTRAAVVRHAESWQSLFAHCGIEPVPGVGQD